MAKTNTTDTLELPYEVIERTAPRNEVRESLKQDNGKIARTTYMIPLKKITIREGYNIRHDMGDIEALAKDILANGLLNPLVLDLVVSGKKRKWVTEQGHRRFMALKLIDQWGELKKIDLQGLRDGAVECFINPTSVTEFDRIVRLFSSNHAKELTALEISEVVRRLEIHFEKTHVQIAEILGCSRQQVDNYAILYKLDDQTKQSIKDGHLTPTDAIARARDVKKKQKEASEKDQKGTSAKSSAGQENEHKIRTAGETIDESEFEDAAAYMANGRTTVYEGDDDDEAQEYTNGHDVFPEPERGVQMIGQAVEQFISKSNPEAENKEEYQLCNRVIQNADKMCAMAEYLPNGTGADFQRLLNFIVKDMEVIREYVKKCKK
ncbi:MAG TPA: ParB N-terminal domain-containing protein [Cyclobacteriaceae bacterium]|nr:ParB N-terminal domain-containing protein [Cyclobacteriaceae bacterium]